MIFSYFPVHAIILFEFLHARPSTHDDEINHISTISKRSLNKLSSSRQVSIQEALHDIAGLDLVICSDYMTGLSLGQALYLRRKTDKIAMKRNLIDSYRNRNQSLENLSLENYFYKHFVSNKFYVDETTSRHKNRILIPKGLNCRPRYPVDYEYAKGMLIMHKPWSKRQPLTDLLRNEDETVSTFLQMIERHQLPYTVVSEYHRAVLYSQQWKYECIAKKASSNDDVDLHKLDNEELHNHLHWEHSRHLSAQNNNLINDAVGRSRVNVGLNYDWTTLKFEGTRAPNRMPPEEYTKYLADYVYNRGDQTNDHVLNILVKKDNSEYCLDDLNEEQQLIDLCALEAVVEFLTNDPTYKPLRATVVGCGGTGKSFIINTLISLVRKYTGLNDTVKVAAPTGGAAYNIGGCTLHRCLTA